MIPFLVSQPNFPPFINHSISTLTAREKLREREQCTIRNPCKKANIVLECTDGNRGLWGKPSVVPTVTAVLRDVVHWKTGDRWTAGLNILKELLQPWQLCDSIIGWKQKHFGQLLLLHSERHRQITRYFQKSRERINYLSNLNKRKLKGAKVKSLQLCRGITPRGKKLFLIHGQQNNKLQYQRLYQNSGKCFWQRNALQQNMCVWYYISYGVGGGDEEGERASMLLIS